jgi:RNA polymerase sigma-70 factor (ECF subfamily)
VSPTPRGLTADSTVTLLPLAASGDRHAIEILVGRMRPYLRRFGHGHLPRWARSRAETEDLVQESLIRALNHLPRFENQSLRDFRAWLHTVFRNLVTDEKRFVGRVGVARDLPADVEDPALSPEEQAVEQSNAGVFERALRCLDPGDRLFIVYRLQHSYSFQDLADELGKPSADAARMAYNRALRRFRTKSSVRCRLQARGLTATDRAIRVSAIAASWSHCAPR